MRRRNSRAGFVLTSPRVQSAEEAIEELCGTMAGLLDRMAAGLGGGPVQAGAATSWLAQARALGGEIRRVDDTLRQAEESTKLNPRSLRLPHSTITLRESLETLEHEAITLRVFARSLADSARLADEDNPLSDPEVRRRLADVLQELSPAVRGAPDHRVARVCRLRKLLRGREIAISALNIGRSRSRTQIRPV